MIKAYIGIGANLGDPVQQIIDARNALYALLDVQEGRSSSLYVSSPLGYEDQADFVNCVIELCVEMKAESLFSSMQLIEELLGRTRDPENQNAARVIDLDLLLFGDINLDTDALTVPHPRMQDRLFVLQPLCELAPSVQVGQLGSAAELLKKGDFTDQQMQKLGA